MLFPGLLTALPRVIHLSAAGLRETTNWLTTPLNMAVKESGSTRSLAALASTLTDEEWQTRLAGDGRKVGVVVHHVASVLPVEIHLAQTLAAGKPVKGITMETIHEMTAVHARDYAAVTKRSYAGAAGAQQRGSRGCDSGVV